MNGSHLLVEARKRAELSQAALASLAGTTQSAIARIERGRSAPTLEHLTKLVRACGFDLQVRLVPYDDHDWALAQENLRLPSTRRLQKMVAVASLRGVARGDSTAGMDDG